MFCNFVNAKDLTGTKLLCYFDSYPDKHNNKGIEFLSETTGKFYEIDNFTDKFNWTLSIEEFPYKISPTKIHIYEKDPTRGDARIKFIIDRVTLKIGAFLCEILDKDINLEEEMQNYLTDSIKKQESLNKL